MATNESIEKGFERLWKYMIQKLKGYLPLSGGTLAGDLTGKNITGTLLQTTEATEKTSATQVCVLEDGWIHWISPYNLPGGGGTGEHYGNYATIEYVNELMTVELTTEV